MARALLLGCESVSKSYGTRTLFDDLSFGLFEGDHAGLVGPNGSGKTTLLKILAGLEAPDRGDALGARRRRPARPCAAGPRLPARPRGGRCARERSGRLALARGRASLPDGRGEVDAKGMLEVRVPAPQAATPRSIEVKAA